MPAVDAKKVLIADPAEPSRRVLAQFLREKGIDVIEAQDGSRALSETLLRRPDALVLDLSVPVLDAERLVQILRSNPNTSGIPIFFLSDREKSVSGFRQGMDEFIRKPFHEEEVLLRIQRALYQGNLSEVLAGDSEISGNLSQVSIPDLWQMLSLNRKSGIIQVESEGISGSIYIEKGEILSALTQGVVGEKALYRLVPLREGRFRFLPGRVEMRRTIHLPSQHAVLEGLRHHDDLRRLAPELPSPLESISVAPDAARLAVGGAAREVLLLAECCTRVEEVVNNCAYPDLVVYQALLQLKRRGALVIGSAAGRGGTVEFLPPEELARLKGRIEKERGAGDGAGRIVFFLPDSSLLESVVLSLGKFGEFEVDNAFFALRRHEGTPIGLFGRIRAGESTALLLYAFPYLRAASPLWYALAPRPVGVIAFLKDEVSSSLESLLAVSDYSRGAKVRAVLAVMGKSFTNFGLGENTLRLFQNRVEKLGCLLKVQEMQRLSPEEIREAVREVIRQFLEEGQA